MLTTPKDFTDDLQNQIAEFYATHSYDEPPKDYMEQTEDTPNDDEDESGGEAKAQRIATPTTLLSTSTSEERWHALNLWQAKCLARLDEGLNARFNYQGPGLPVELRAKIRRGLDGCADADQVRALFAGYMPQSLEDDLPPIYHTTQQQYERQQIARKWRERRLAAEREM